MRFCFLLIALCGVAHAQQAVLTPFAQIRHPAVKEPSGIVKSRQHDDVYWIHPDSGQIGNIFAIRMDGQVVMPEDTDGIYTGIYVKGAVNLDWEDIATDDAGHLYIGDLGDNLLFRPFLSVYQVKEPDPEKDFSVDVIKRMDLRFPPGTSERNVEALVHARGALHILSKHRRGGSTTLYRYDPEQKHLLQVGEINVKSMVTAADYDEASGKLAVLTYDGVWVFKAAADAASLFSGEVFWRPYTGTRSAEAIAFRGKHMLILGEDLKLYDFKFSNLLRAE